MRKWALISKSLRRSSRKCDCLNEPDHEAVCELELEVVPIAMLCAFVECVLKNSFLHSPFERSNSNSNGELSRFRGFCYGGTSGTTRSTRSSSIAIDYVDVKTTDLEANRHNNKSS